MNEINAIEIHNLNKTFKKYGHRKTIREYILPAKKPETVKGLAALRDINLEIKKGECVGIIGRNGSGKSTLLNIMMGSLRGDKGSQVITRGKMMRLALGMGVDDNLTARDNIYVNGSIIGLTFKRIGEIFHDIIEFAGLEDFIDTPVKYYSKGMKQRLLFAIAMYAEADIFLLDEFFGGVGDEDYKEKSEKAFHEQILHGKTVVIVSHSMPVIENFCHRAFWLHKGRINSTGTPNDVISEYLDHFKQPSKLKE